MTDLYLGIYLIEQPSDKDKQQMPVQSSTANGVGALDRRIGDPSGDVGGNDGLCLFKRFYCL